MREATLCYPVVDDRVLLIEKKRGVGEGKVNGPGGKLEGEETPHDCVVREVRGRAERVHEVASGEQSDP